MIDSTKNIIIFLMTVLLYTSFCALSIIFRTNKKFFERNSNMNFSIIGKLYFPIILKTTIATSSEIFSLQSKTQIGLEQRAT